ncbi:carbohydrate ABC transporter permease [Prosthecomicrobium pneumaticum]|uniref:Multiple sugar transport system permease protein n=1 Tax=Prosthecomicrobium pneumaticum TaxID=81895 RepID=A0A7W9CV27_9HYPH|nr:carbohydrate ABC transporter permease [Prosthecomicrobium pneumaticum]MBB5752437.1 multiple sugar transport system permease protein [Prosthecomicrobium pneumaticum]
MIVSRANRLAKATTALRWAVFVLVALVLNFPILATVLTSFKTMADINTSPPPLIFWPTLENYVEVLFAGNADFPRYLFNSVVMASGGAVIAILLAFPAAYAMVRYDVGKSWLLPIITNLRALPLIIYAIPIYLMFQFAGLLDTRFGLALIAAVINVPVALVLFVGFIQDIPDELDAAAKIDGAGKWGILRHVIFPLSRPILFAVAILSFIYAWNEFIFGLILTTRQAVPVTVGATFFVTTYGVKWGATAAAMTLGIIPPLVLGLFAYPYIGKSMLTGALKG